jgi:hypothetical protein
MRRYLRRNFGDGRQSRLCETSMCTTCRVVELIHRPTWVEAKTYRTLRDHANLGSSLVLLKSPDWSHTLSLYPVSTLAANCNLVVNPTDSKVYMNVRRCQPDVETEVYVVRGRTTGSSDAGKVVKVAVDAARQLVGGKRQGGGSDYWDGLGICTWESFGKRCKYLLKHIEGQH